jgi:hypothetical protein
MPIREGNGYFTNGPVQQQVFTHTTEAMLTAAQTKAMVRQQ